MGRLHIKKHKKVGQDRLEIRRVLVTGGAGFIGSHTVDALIESGDIIEEFMNEATGLVYEVNKREKQVEYSSPRLFIHLPANNQ